MSLNNDESNDQVLLGTETHANDQALPVEVAHAHEKDRTLESEAPADASALSVGAVGSVAGPIGAVAGTVGPVIGPAGGFAGILAGGMLEAAAGNEDRGGEKEDDSIYTKLT